SGKTNTMAHRVAHLMVNGADPRRILLMTFSRRAAAEMTRRAERIARQVMGSSADVMTEALTWAGTFHGIGARLLREYADQIGIDPAFTIHDRVDLGHPFPRLGPGRNWRRVILGIGKVLRDSLRRCGHAVERLARIE